MKFGQSLFQRSVAQWRSYNIDYDSIKQLIKANTTPGSGKAISIPGQGDTVGREFGQLLFSVLGRECDRISLFVKSKCYEVNSRLSLIERQLVQLKNRRTGVDPRRGTLQTRRKLSRIESDILAVGEEIENLSRFIAINRLAIRKLLKKFRKWTGQTALGERVEEQILNQPSSFARIDLKPALDQYSAYLDAVRTLVYDEKDFRRLGVDSLVVASPEALSPTISYEAAKSPVEFDVEFASLSSGVTSTAYWVHSDNVVQLRILLLQYMRYAKFAMSQDSTQGSSATERDEGMGILVLDDPDRLRSRAFKSSTEEKEKKEVILATFAASAHWSGHEDALVSISEEEGIRREKAVAFVQKDQLSSFLSQSYTFHLADQNSPRHDNQKAVQAWLSEHKNLSPLTLVWQQRTRFVGLDNTAASAHSAWAALDEDVRITPMSHEKLESRDFFDESTHRNVSDFPHAVLLIKIDGEDKGLLRVLDHSHLTERVSGFSIEAHAVATSCSYLSLPTPSWYSTLQKDIRHIPSATSSPGPSRRTSTHNLSLTSNTPRRASRSATSRTLTAPTSPTAIPTPPNADTTNGKATANRVTLTDNDQHKKRQMQQKLHRQQQLQSQQAPTPYWNEYDYGSEYGDGADGAFVIYVDPNAPVFPTLSRWKGKITSLFSAKKQRTVDNTDGKQSAFDTDLERQPLTSAAEDALALTLTSESSDDDEGTNTENPASRTAKAKAGKPTASFLGFRTSYGTTTTSAGKSTNTRTKPSTASAGTAATHFHTSTICLAASLIVLAIVTVLATTGRRKLRNEVDVAVLVGVVAAVGFAVVGVGGLVRGASKVGIVRKLCVGAVFAGICVWGGALVAWVVV